MRHQLNLTLSPEQHAAIAEAAARELRKPTEWAVSVLVRAALDATRKSPPSKRRAG